MPRRRKPIASHEDTVPKAHGQDSRPMRHHLGRTLSPGGKIRKKMSLFELKKLEET
jgi:hypothetical protein